MTHSSVGHRVWIEAEQRVNEARRSGTRGEGRIKGHVLTDTERRAGRCAWSWRRPGKPRFVSVWGSHKHNAAIIVLIEETVPTQSCKPACVGDWHGNND